MTYIPIRNLIGTIEPASYREQPIDDYRGNPLIEALPPINSPREVVRYMANLPRFSEEEKELEPHVRLHCVMRMENFLHPLNRHVALEQTLSVVIRRGYMSRNPLTANHARMLRHIALSLQNPTIARLESGQFEIPKSTATGKSIVGMSGIGKSTAVERIVMQYPQVLLHSGRLDHKQVVWIKVDCPPDGSLRSLCIDFLQVFDDLFGTHEAERLAPVRKANTDYLLGRMSLTAFNHSLGILIIDEIQNLNQASSGGKEKMLNFFVSLANKIGVPVLLIGNPSIEPTFQSELRDGRRFEAEPGWTRLQPGTSDWDKFLRNLWRFQWIKHFTPLTQEIEGVVYAETMGIPDLIVKLFAIAQIRAMTSGKERIDPGLLRRTAKEAFYHLQVVLDAIRTGKDLRKFRDVEHPIKITDHVQQALEKLVGSQSIVTESDSEQDVIEWLLSVGHTEAVAIRATRQAKQNDLNQWRREALKIADGMVEQASEVSGKPVKTKTARSQKSLSGSNTNKSKRKVIDKQVTPVIYAAKIGKAEGVIPYHALVGAGFVPDSVKFILTGELVAKTVP